MSNPSPTLDQDPGAGGGTTTPSDIAGQQDKTDYKKLYEEAQAKATKELDTAEKRRAGLQVTYQKEQDAHKVTTTELEQLRGELTVLTSEKSSFQDTLSKLETEKTGQEIELETLRRKDKRASLIMGKFPELATFEADGLLPEAEEEKLEETFGNFLTKLGVIKEKGKEDFGKGGVTTPPPPKTTEPEGAKALMLQINAAAIAGDQKLYNELYDKYVKATQKA
jgi:hypothetical protein